MTNRQRIRRLAATALIALLTPAATAHADQRPATDPRLTAMLDAADQFAHAHYPGLERRCTPHITIADRLPAADGRANRATCTIILRRAAVRLRLQIASDPAVYRRDRRDSLAELCRTVVHEDLHLRGLDHTPDGIMAERPTVTPWNCTLLARQLTASPTDYPGPEQQPPSYLHYLQPKDAYRPPQCPEAPNGAGRPATIYVYGWNGAAFDKAGVIPPHKTLWNGQDGTVVWNGNTRRWRNYTAQPVLVAGWCAIRSG